MAWHGGSNTKGKEVEQAEKKAKALNLRKMGLSYAEIAKQIGYADRSNAHRLVKQALNELWMEPAEELRQLELERLDVAQLAVMKAIAKGDIKAVDKMIKVMDHRAKLTGLYILDTADDGSEVGKAFVELLDSVKQRINTETTDDEA